MPPFLLISAICIVLVGSVWWYKNKDKVNVKSTMDVKPDVKQDQTKKVVQDESVKLDEIEDLISHIYLKQLTNADKHQ